MFACNGILFNHESPLRGETFVTRKITPAVARIKLGLQQKMYLGNLDAKRDWGYAKDYVEAMQLMLQQDTPEDFVIATGETYSVREFVELAFAVIDVRVVWQGNGVEEIGYNERTGAEIVLVDKNYFRPTEVDCLQGNAAKSKELLGWQAKTSLAELVTMMIREDLRIAERDILCYNAGYKVANYNE